MDHWISGFLMGKKMGFWIGKQDSTLHWVTSRTLNYLNVLKFKFSGFDFVDQTGTARALAYLHQECESKIIHCDIKPENVLLDDNFTPKLSDFGMAKLVNREQSNIFTQLRGTRGYMAPEWITNLAISDKSDVYSYGMVLLEIVANRKCYDADQSPESGKLRLAELPFSHQYSFARPGFLGRNEA